jgi:hypothetical protein
MSEGANPLAGIVGFWMLMQLASTLALLLGGIYALYCLSRAASGMERLAAAIERIAAERAMPNLQTPGMPPAGMPSREPQSGAGGVVVPPTYPAATPQPFVPHVPSAAPTGSVPVGSAPTGVAPTGSVPVAPVSSPPVSTSPDATSDATSNEAPRLP